jgi:serine/threonine protein kinase
MPLSNGETFAGFRIMRLLGSGGMGEVYLAEHPRLPDEDPVRLKTTWAAAVWIASGVLRGGESSESRGALEQAEFVVKVRGHRAQAGDGVAAAGQPERDRIVGAGAGDVQRLPVNRD